MTKRPTEKAKDSWKKLGMDLAANRAQPGQICHAHFTEPGCEVCEMKKLYRRARALRKSSRRKGK